MSSLIIDNLDSITGWTASNGSLSFSLNQSDSEYIANDLTASLLIYFNNSQNNYAQKIFGTAIDVSKYNELVISIASLKLGDAGNDFNNLDNFNYSLIINDSITAYALPTGKTLCQFKFDLNGITSITKIKILALTNQKDYLIISNLVAVNDQVPLDIYKALQIKLQDKRDELNSFGTAIKTGLTLSAGDKDIRLDFPSFAYKHSVIKISDGVQTEYHQVQYDNEKYFTFDSLFDGSLIKYNYTNASVYLFPEIMFGSGEREVVVPSINIYGFNHAKQDHTKFEFEYDTMKVDRTIERRFKPEVFKYILNLDCIARNLSNLQWLKDIVDQVLSSNKLWINGLKFDIDFESDADFIDFEEIENVIPKINYKMSIEVKEYWQIRTILPNTSSIALTANISLE